MFPSIPSNINQLIILTGFIVIGLAFSNIKDAQRNLEQKSALLDSYLQKTSQLLLNDVVQAKQLGEKINAIKTFSETATANKDYANLDSVLKEQKIYSLIDTLKLKIEIYKADEVQEQKIRGEVNRAERIFDRVYKLALFSSCIGLLLVCLGVYELNKQNYLSDKYQILQIAEKKASVGYLECQSCCKKFSSVIKKGFESDGTENKAFCRTCYDFGRFTNPSLTSTEVINDILSKGDFQKKTKIKKVKEKVESLDRWSTRIYNFNLS